MEGSNSSQTYRIKFQEKVRLGVQRQAHLYGGWRLVSG